MADQQVVVELVARTEKLQKGFKKAEKTSQSFGKKLAKGMMVATAAIAGVTVVLNKLLKTFTEYGLKIDKASKVTGMAAEALQKWGYIAKQEHGSFDAVIKAFTMLSQRMVDAEQGLETYAREFREMGIDLRDAEGNLRSVNDVFLDMGTYVQNTTNQTEAMGHIGKLLGARYVKDLMPILKLTTEQIDQLAKEAEALGIVLDTKTIKAIKKFDDEMTKMKEGFKGVIYQAGAALLPVLNQLPALLISITPLLTKVMEIVGSLLSSIIPFIKNILDPLMKLLMPILDAVASALDQILEPLLRPLVKIIEILVKILEPFFKLLEPILKVALAPIVNKLEILTPILDMIMTLLEPIMAILTPFTDILGMLFDIGGDLIKTVMQPFINLLTRLSDKLKVWVEKWLPRFTACIYEVKAAIVRVIEAIKNTLLGMVNWVIRQMNKLGLKLEEIQEGAGAEDEAALIAGLRAELARKAAAARARGGEPPPPPPGAPPTGEGKATTEKIVSDAELLSDALVAIYLQSEEAKEKYAEKIEEESEARWEEIVKTAAEALQIIENRLRAWANITREIFGGPIRKAFKDAFGFLKLQLKETEGIFVGFLKSLWNSLMDFAAKVLANSLIQLAVKLVSMLVSPGSAVATMGIKDIIFKALGFDNPWNDAMMQRQGRDIVRHLVTGMQGALEPAFAGGGRSARTIVVRLPDPIGAFAEVYEETDPDSQQRFGRATRKAVGRDKEAD